MTLAIPYNRLYQAWKNMRARCYGVRRPDYKYYGGRGITVCGRWNSFPAFAEDMGPHPGKGWTLDRKNNNQGYSKRNCRWATSTRQNRNKRTTKLTEQAVHAIRLHYIRGRGPENRGNWASLCSLYQIDRALLASVVTARIWKDLRCE